MDQVRKEITKTRIRSNVEARSRPSTVPSQEIIEVEEAIFKLAESYKGTVKVEEFTKRDKHHLLDIFVNS